MIVEKIRKEDLIFVRDDKGDEVLLKNGIYQIMMSWEKPYAEACIDVIQPFGDVLEIGFGCGFSASHIQTYFPKNHTIIEKHPEIFKRAKRWSQHHTNIKLIQEPWQKVLEKLGLFDAIYFNDHRMMADAISDNEIYELSEGILNLEQTIIMFLENCLNNHMRKGSRFSCFTSDPSSKFSNKLWFDKIISNPFLDYQERKIPVEVPKNCGYYFYKEALVISVTKK